MLDACYDATVPVNSVEMGPRFVPPPRSPSAQRQGQRITPHFSALSEALDARRIEAAQSTSESDPELVVVFDLAGTVPEFMRAVRGVEGLEFLAELDDEPLDPDEDFHFVVRDGEPLDRQVPETLYMVMSNAQAVTELIRLFTLWQADQRVKFARGLAPLKDAFVLLRAVRRWGPEDRVRETGLLDAWREDVQVAGSQGTTRVEIELWFRQDSTRRDTAHSEVERIVLAAGGSIVGSAIIESIEYHGVLADLPYSQVEAVLARGVDAIDLLTTESIMFVAPARPMSVPILDTVAAPTDLGALSTPSTVVPRVALLDGLPLANHDALAGRLVVDDPDEFTARYSSGRQHHGTAMASLICHGDLSASGAALSTQLYVRPIMQPHEFFPDREVVAPDELIVDLIHRCFVRLFDGDAAHPAAAPSVRIVNLSIGDPARVFARRMSPLAKLLDWLSHKYNVLVLVSAGNHSFSAAVSTENLDDPDALHQDVVTTRYMHARQLGLLSPAEAVNVLTVGAIHADAAVIEQSDTVIDAIPLGMPAAYGAVGFGHRRSVKPEILMPGGRQLFQRPLPDATGGPVNLIEARHSATGPGVLVAAPAPAGGSNGIAFSCGTSNSTALASRAANEIFDVLGAIPPADEFAFPDAQYHPVLAKTLLVHAAEWGNSGRVLQTLLDLEPRSARRDMTQVLGYGSVVPEHVATAARTRVVLLGAGSISAGQRNKFNLPLPAGLAATTEWRRLTITLGWISPINARSWVHRQARLRFNPPDGQLGAERTQADTYAARMGTLQHEIFEGRAALAFAAGDSVQVYVDCRVDAGRIAGPVRYGLAVSIEMAPTVRVDIHAQMQQGLRAEVRARAQVAPR